MEYEREELLDENLARVRELQASWSPSVFIGGRMISRYHGEWGMFTDDDPDSFKEYLCTLEEMKDVC